MSFRNFKLSYLLHNVKDVSTFFTEDTVHGGVVGNNNLEIYIQILI